MSSFDSLPTPGLPFPWRWIETLLRGSRIQTWSPLFTLDPVLLGELASREIDLDDFGPGYFRKALRIFLLSAREEADLNLLGRRGISGLVLTLLKNRLLFHDFLKKNPCLRETPLRDPIFLLGMPRSGSTFLHRLLAEDRRLRALPYWRLSRPLPPAGDDDRRKEAQRTLSIRKSLTPELDQKHFIGADSYEECIWLLNSTFVSQGLAVAAPVWSYVDWLNSPDSMGPRGEAYREYSLYLQMFQAEEPDRRLVLKAPFHTGSIEILHSLFPGASFIQTHRSPVEACPSLASLFYSTHRPLVDSLDPERLGAAIVETMETELARNLAARDRFHPPILDLPYSRLTDDTERVLAEIYRHISLDWSEKTRRAAVEFLEKNRRHKYGRHEYHLGAFDMRREGLASTFEFYTSRFDL